MTLVPGITVLIITSPPGPFEKLDVPAFFIESVGISALSGRHWTGEYSPSVVGTENSGSVMPLIASTGTVAAMKSAGTSVARRVKSVNDRAGVTDAASGDVSDSDEQPLNTMRVEAINNVAIFNDNPPIHPANGARLSAGNADQIKRVSPDTTRDVPTADIWRTAAQHFRSWRDCCDRARFDDLVRVLTPPLWHFSMYRRRAAKTIADALAVIAKGSTVSPTFVPRAPTRIFDGATSINYRRVAHRTHRQGDDKT